AILYRAALQISPTTRVRVARAIRRGDGQGAARRAAVRVAPDHLIGDDRAGRRVVVIDEGVQILGGVGGGGLGGSVGEGVQRQVAEAEWTRDDGVSCVAGVALPLRGAPGCGRWRRWRRTRIADAVVVAVTLVQVRLVRAVVELVVPVVAVAIRDRVTGPGVVD